MSDHAAFQEAMTSTGKPTGKTHKADRQDHTSHTLDEQTDTTTAKGKGKRKHGGKATGGKKGKTKGKYRQDKPTEEQWTDQWQGQWERPKWQDPTDRKRTWSQKEDQGGQWTGRDGEGQRGASRDSGVPDQPKRVKLTPRPPAGTDILLLTAFDGVGAGPWLVEQTLGRPKAAAAWEIDQACIKITAHRLPWVEQRGDIHQDSPSTSWSGSTATTHTKSAWYCGRRHRHARTSHGSGKTDQATPVTGEACSCTRSA